MDPVVEFRCVSVRRGGRHVLRNATFSVRPGETVVLLGRSGAGKTTALRLVNAMLLPDEGEVLVEGRPTSQWDPVRLRRRTGYAIQESGLFPHYTVARNIGLVPRLEGWPEDRVHARVREMLDLVGLDPLDFAPRFPRQLSGGQRQRVGVARALAADPPVLLLDEPFGALDPVTRVELQRHFASLQRRLAKAVLLVTHDVREALLLGSRIVLLDQGRIAVDAPPDAFLSSQHPEARAFLACLEGRIP